MKKSIIIALAMLMSVTLQANQIAQTSTAEEYVTKLRQRYARDPRVAIFDISVSREQTLVIISGKTNIPEAKEALDRFAQENGYNTNALTLLPTADIGALSYGYVTLSTTSLRREPRFPAELISQAILGTPIRIWERANNWLRIQTPDGYLGWVTDTDITAMTREQAIAWSASKHVIITATYGKSYSKADITSRPVSDITVGCIFNLVEELDNWLHVRYPDGRVAFIPRSDAMLFEDWEKSITLTGESVVAKAFSYMGIPYLWGGTSSKALDCSGYTKTVYGEHGLILPRDASQQALCGKPVTITPAYEQLQPGDLLFFGSQPSRITHVGIYIGNKEFIHESGDVHINSLDSLSPIYTAKYANTLQHVRRLIGTGANKGYSTIKNNPYYHIKP